MRKITLITMFLSFLLLFASCDETPSLTIGYNPQGTPFNISFNTDGELKVFIGGRILTPIGTFFANESLTETYSFHTTFIEIYDRNSELKHVFQLTKDEQFKMNSKYRTSIHIVEKENSTVVTIDSDEITNFIKIAREKEPKPRFSETPIPYFWLTKRINVDWSINNFGDFLLDIFFIILYFIAICIDLIIIVVLFALRLLWFLILGLIYVVRSIF